MANATMSKDEILEAIGNCPSSSSLTSSRLSRASSTSRSRLPRQPVRLRPVRRCSGSGRRRADRVHGQAEGCRRQEDPGHQGRSRDHGPRPEGSEGSRRRRTAGREGRCVEGRSCYDQDQAGRAGRRRRGEVRALIDRARGGRHPMPPALRSLRACPDLHPGACVHHRSLHGTTTVVSRRHAPVPANFASGPGATAVFPVRG